MEPKHGTISIKTIQENGSILSPEFYLKILPELEKPIKFKSALNPLFERTIKLNLEKLDIDTKLLIYSLLQDKEKLIKIEEYLKGGIKEIK